MPYFVDAQGARCALAHLIESTGGAALVARIAAARNNARVHELAGDPALAAWLEQAGIAAAEAALIQPAYCGLTRAEVCFCDPVAVTTPTGVLEATVLEAQQSGGVDQVTARVSVLHGDTGGIAAGQLISAYAAAAANDTLLIPVAADTPVAEYAWGVRRVQSDGILAYSCKYPVMPLTKEQAIQAMLIQPRPQGYMTACREYLQRLDSAWGKSICDRSSGCGVAAADGTGSPLVLGAALAVAARRCGGCGDSAGLDPRVGLITPSMRTSVLATTRRKPSAPKPSAICARRVWPARQFFR